MRSNELQTKSRSSASKTFYLSLFLKGLFELGLLHILTLAERRFFLVQPNCDWIAPQLKTCDFIPPL
jgi:hypothetical protein